ncbi:glycerophosphodiester phosphodiesterase [Nakamurella lactea]|uniref:glycerophosphodiester phosphodiesterase n=1 Tax=Nakamurella lactea TaxID=459515 RepID=UPI0003F9EE3E|nr:glycerophosphodiester phosphodiesterase family protein [Nakamurella lactea]
MSQPQSALTDDPTPRPLVVGHRGASAAAPENTMAAFRAAWDAGVRWLETDTQPSIDNVPVLIHDDDVDRTTSGTGAVRESRALDLATLDAGSWFGDAFAGERIPELSALLAELPADGRVFLEIKGQHTREQLVAILEVSRASGADDRVLLQSFERDALATLRSISPDRPLGLLTVGWDTDPVAAARELGAVTYNPHHLLLRGQPDPAGAVAALHDAGIAVSVWTADEVADWEVLTDLGVDAIITNKPAELAQWLAARVTGG